MTGHTWPTRDEWAYRRKHPYLDGDVVAPVTRAIAAYASPQEISETMAKLNALQRTLFRTMRAIKREAGSLLRQPKETSLHYVTRCLAMPESERAPLTAYDRARWHRQDVRRALQAILQEQTLPLEVAHHSEELVAILGPLVQRWSVASRAEHDRCTKEIADRTPIDDAAWQRELERRAGFDRGYGRTSKHIA